MNANEDNHIKDFSRFKKNYLQKLAEVLVKVSRSCGRFSGSAG
jgi:hypothetical protein